MRNKFVLAGVAAAIAMFSVAGSAEAGKRHFGFGGGFNKHHFHHRHHFFGGSHFSGGGCGFYYRKWLRTGKWFWKNRYYDCIG